MSTLREHEYMQKAVDAIKGRRVFCLMPDDLADDPEILANWASSKVKKIADTILRKNGGDIEMAYVEAIEKMLSHCDKTSLLETAREALAVQEELIAELEGSGWEKTEWRKPPVINRWVATSHRVDERPF